MPIEVAIDPDILGKLREWQQATARAIAEDVDAIKREYPSLIRWVIAPIGWLLALNAISYFLGGPYVEL